MTSTTVHPALARTGTGVAADGTFDLPTRVQFGRGVVSTLAEEAQRLAATRVMVVTDPGVRAIGLVAAHRAIDYVRDRNRRFGIPDLAQLIEEADLDMLAEKAFANTSTPSDPLSPDVAAFRRTSPTSSSGPAARAEAPPGAPRPRTAQPSGRRAPSSCRRRTRLSSRPVPRSHRTRPTTTSPARASRHRPPGPCRSRKRHRRRSGTQRRLPRPLACPGAEAACAVPCLPAGQGTVRTGC